MHIFDIITATVQTSMKYETQENKRRYTKTLEFNLKHAYVGQINT